MNAVAEIVDDATEFFAPTDSDVIDRLIGEYQQYRRHIDCLAGIATGEMSGAIHYFITGNRNRERYMPSVSELFEPKGAIFALNAAYWSKAMNLTDVYSAMPKARRDFWNAQLRGEKTATEGNRTVQVPPLPDFEESTVRNTLSDLLGSRAKFFAERVDGIFRALSGNHVTNCPEAFGKRMIIANVITSYGTTDHDRAGHISDLRVVIAKFMGRDEPSWTATTHLVQTARNNPGEWIVVDGGAFKLKCFKVGTAHLEVHPDISYRLNQILAHLYPTAIPAKFRQKPVRKSKEFQMMRRPLPFAVIRILEEVKQLSERIKPDWPERYVNVKNAITFGYGDKEKTALAEAGRIMESIGGVRYMGRDCWFQFDYSPLDIIREIVASGCIPDQKSHQFYPTPESIATAAIELAQIGENDLCLEPSAGQGGLAAFMPQGRTTCIEISPLHCSILKAKGFNAVESDFVEWAKSAPKFDRVVMNPPFSEGRAKQHVEVAAGLVKHGGRLVAILPSSFKGKEILTGWSCEWSQVFSNEFAGTSVSVVILCGVKL